MTHFLASFIFSVEDIQDFFRLLVPCKMATASFSEHSVTIFQFTLRHMPDTWIYSFYITVIPCNLVGDCSYVTENWQWLCKCRVHVQRFAHLPEECSCADDRYESSNPKCFTSLRSSTFIWYLFRCDVYLTDCTEMLFTTSDLLSSSKMSFLQSTVYDSYASSFSVYLVRGHQDQWMARNILNGFCILNFLAGYYLK